MLGVVLLLGILCSQARGVNPYLAERRKARILSEGPLVETIEFVGNETFEGAELLRYMDTRESGFLSVVHFKRGVLDDDIGAIASVRHGREAGMQGLELRVSHAGHGHHSGKLGGNPVFVLGAHIPSLRRRMLALPELIAPPQKLSMTALGAPRPTRAESWKMRMSSLSPGPSGAPQSAVWSVAV